MIARFLVFSLVVSLVAGHARFIEPPSRASAWRYGFDTPVDYDDNGSNCGGFSHQYDVNDGKCGICGDPWDEDPREHEVGGTYATGTIVEVYTQGQQFVAVVDVTANHLGHMEFRICPSTDESVEVTQECLDQYPLYKPDGSGPEHEIGELPGNYTFDLVLPEGLTCEHCVIQWKYIAGNNWGKCIIGGMGCGDQEEFRACADVTVNPNYERRVSATARRPEVTNEKLRAPTSYLEPIPIQQNCFASDDMKMMIGLDKWCQINCSRNPPFCPSSHCACL